MFCALVVAAIALTHLALGPRPEDRAQSAAGAEAAFCGPASGAAAMDEF
jgi:hypothetical protein